MKRNLFFGAVLLLITLAQAAQAEWIVDQASGFKIKVPKAWQKSQLKDGTDRIHVFLSPDENVAVRIRAFEVNPQVKMELIISLFESNILGQSQRLALMDHVLNGYAGKLAAYKGNYNGTAVGAGAFFTVQDGMAYIVWSLTPIALFQARSAEADAITNTFTLLKSAQTAPVSNGGAPGLGNTFAETGMGYAIGYPGDWVYTKTQPHIVVFGGREGTPAYHATVTVQNLASTRSGGNFNKVLDVMNHFQRQLFNGATDILMSEIQPFSKTLGGRQVEGSQVAAEFTREQTVFRQRLVIVPRPDQKLFHALIYTAPKEDYDRFEPVAKAMLDSWSIH